MSLIHFLGAVYAENSHALIIAAVVLAALAFAVSVMRSTTDPAPAPQRRRATDSR